MRIQVTIRYILAFFTLNMIMGELHEQAHINTGFLVCGCYGARDFNVWATCDQCANPSLAFLSTLAGPVFSCILMWVGAFWFTKSKQVFKQVFGFSLLFANLPFARIFTALMGGGDEKVVIQSLLNDQSNSTLSKILAAIIVLLICLPPILMVLSKLANRNRGWIIAAFAIIPLLYGMLYHHMFLNSLLKKGILAETHFLGTPDIILLHLLLMLILFLVCRKGILQLQHPEARTSEPLLQL